MHLIEWKPLFAAKGQYGYERALRFWAKLQCPVCRGQATVTTRGHLVGNVSLATNISWEISGINEVRPCENCGVMSRLPREDLERLRREASTRVTSEWVEVELKKYVDSQDKKWVSIRGE